MMPASGPRPGQVAVQVSLAAIFVSLELSRSTWLINSLVTGGGDKMSKHSVRCGADGPLRQVAGQGARPGRCELPDYRHSGSRSGRLLGSSRTGAGGDREP